MAATTLIDRALLRISGHDPRAFLQGLVTNNVEKTLPAWAGLLTPQGKALFDFIIWTDDDDLLLDVERDQIGALERRLAIYRLRRPIVFSREDRLAVHWSRDQPAPAIRHHIIDSGAWPPSIVPDPRLPALGWRWLAPSGEAAEGWTAHRLSLGVTEGLAELGSGETLWLECNAHELNGVDFAKGCYVGQENTARMHHRAKVGRRLVVAPLGIPTDRTRAQYPELGLMVEHRRVDALGDALIPGWLASALA